MRTISLRKFRDSIADIGESVEVARRDPDGNIQVIGTWQPNATHPKGSRPLVVDSGPPFVHTLEDAGFNSRPFTPVPKVKR